MKEFRKSIAWFIVFVGFAVLFILACGWWRQSESQPMPLVKRLEELVFGPRQPEMPAVLVRGAQSEIKTIYNLVQGEFLFREGNNHPLDMEATIRGLMELMDSPNFEILRLATGTNHVFIALNPEVRAWSRPHSFDTEIAAYWPLRLFDPKEGKSGLVGIYFGGQVAFLEDEPAWEAFSLSK